MSDVRFARFDFSHVTAGEYKSWLRAVDALNYGCDTNPVHIAEDRLPAYALFTVLTDIIKDTLGRCGNPASQLPSRLERLPRVVVDDEEGRQVLCHVYG